jgi:lysophospholipase L1-like esterase
MAVLVAAAAAIAAPAVAPPPCTVALCNADALAPFFARLRDGGGAVHIIQIGDSHTAGDMITNSWRVRLQARYGNGGRGALAAGRPYPGYLTWGITAAQSGGWSANATFGAGYRNGGPPLGLSGFTQTARGPGETLAVAADSADAAFDRIVVCAIAQPSGGALVLRMGAATQLWSLDAPQAGPACRTMDSDAPVAAASITTADGGIASIASFGTFRRGSGLVLSNLGVVGAQLAHFARTDDALVRAELAAYRPDLIVLAFGTNEGFSPSLTADGYEAGLRAQVARLRGLAAAEVPILLLGAPDAAARGSGLACGEGWVVPRLLGEIRERQRRVATELGLAFWDWAAAMGGACASSAWRRDGLMRGDHVHFTRSGAERIGALLDADLAAAIAAADRGRR